MLGHLMKAREQRLSHPVRPDRGQGMDSPGFTLVELLIAIAIIGILAGAATTAYIGTTKKAARSEAYSNLESLRLLQERFRADNGDYTGNRGGAACGSDVDRDANLAAIQIDLPLFKPGSGANFCYQILADEDVSGAATAEPCFHAVARGLPNTRVENDTFDIDCNNDRTF